MHIAINTHKKLNSKLIEIIFIPFGRKKTHVKDEPQNSQNLSSVEKAIPLVYMPKKGHGRPLPRQLGKKTVTTKLSLKSPCVWALVSPCNPCLIPNLSVPGNWAC